METKILAAGYLDKARETMPPEERRRRLESGFLAQWAHVWAHSRAYREIYAEAGVSQEDVTGLNDLHRLPVVRMEDLVTRQHADPPFGGFETVPLEKIRRIYVNPGLIWQPGDWEYTDTSWAEALAGGGFGPGDRVVNTFNYHLWPYAFMLDESTRMIGATAIPTGVGNTLMQVKIMQMLKVNAFMGTPSFLMTLTQRAEDMGLDVRKDLGLEKAVVGAEMLPESLRARLEAKMGMTITQCYGTVFLGCLGYECARKTGLHVPEEVLVEIVDPHTGLPVADGATGEIVATCFSRTYPLIRFATGDLSLFTAEPCPCGRTGPMLKKVLGRIDQATKVRGTFVHPWQTDELAAKHPEIFKYQVVISREEDTDVMTFRVEPRDDSAPAGLLAARLERDIKDMLTIKGEVEIVPRGTIPDFYNKIDDRRTWE